MKKIVILCTVVLLVLLPAALVVGCQQPAPAPPAPAPTPPTAPAPTPPAPAPPAPAPTPPTAPAPTPPAPAPTPPPAPPPPPAPTPTPPTIESLTYTNSEYGFSVEYPKDWDAEEDLMVTGMVVAFMGPSVLGGLYRVNINIMTEQLPTGTEITLDDYCTAVTSNYERQFGDYKKNEEYDTSVSGLPAKVWTYTLTVEGTTLRNCQAILIKDKVAYIITYDVTVDSHDEYADCFELVISTFKFETPPPTPETLTYTNSEYGFSCDYPGDWDFEEGLMGTIVMFAGPFIEEEEFIISMNIVSEELPKFPKVTLEDFAKMGEMGLKKVFENYKKVDEHSATIGDLPAIVRTYTGDLEGVRQMQTQAYFFKENVAYVVTYGATPKSHNEYLDCFELVINSFKFE